MGMDVVVLEQVYIRRKIGEDCIVHAYKHFSLYFLAIV
jgi:hypothetical protein